MFRDRFSIGFMSFLFGNLFLTVIISLFCDGIFMDARWQCSQYGMIGKENYRIETCVNYRRIP